MTVGTKRYAIDPVMMPRECMKCSTILAPKFDGLVTTCCDNHLTVRAKHYAIDAIAMPCQLIALLDSVEGLPQPVYCAQLDLIWRFCLK